LQDPQVAKSLLGGCRARGVRQVVSPSWSPGTSGESRIDRYFLFLHFITQEHHT
jgi:hypothetical protein